MNDTPKHIGSMAAAVIAVALALPGVASAQHVSSVLPTVTALGNGDLRYTYAITNLPGSTVNIGDIFINVPNEVTATNLVLPAGFLSLYTPGFTPLEFISTDPAADIRPGQTDVFSVDSSAGPGLQPYLTRSFDDGSDSTGTTLAPTVVPEPASLAVVAAVGSLALRRRRR